MSIPRSGVARSSLATAAVTTLTATLLTAGSPGTAAAKEITCDDTPGRFDFYPGPSASATYDTFFARSHHIPNLDTYIPQGTATWSNWDGDGQDLILITGYHKPDNPDSLISAIDAKTGRYVGSAFIDHSHVGGIAIFEKKGWAYVSGSADLAVRKYSLADLKAAIKAPTNQGKKVTPKGKDQIVYGNSFLTSHGPSNTLWAGKFNDFIRDYMRSYTVADNGDLTERPGTWQVPTKTQGLVVTEDLFIYSTSLGRDNPSNIYVVRRGDGSSDLDTARLYCFRAPTMSEGLTVYGKDLYAAFESGAYYYNQGSDKPRNVIRNLHKTRLGVDSLKTLPPR